MGECGEKKNLKTLLGEKTKSSACSYWRGTAADSLSESLSAAQCGNTVWVDVPEIPLHAQFENSWSQTCSCRDPHIVCVYQNRNGTLASAICMPARLVSWPWNPKKMCFYCHQSFFCKCRLCWVLGQQQEGNIFQSVRLTWLAWQAGMLGVWGRNNRWISSSKMPTVGDIKQASTLAVLALQSPFVTRCTAVSCHCSSCGDKRLIK